jgi:AmmeMemoRadiSam system protein A
MGYDHVLTDEEKQELIRIARATLKEFVRSGRVPPGKPHRETLLARAGAFVSLHRGEELRGCIGTQQETTPLYKTIQEMAVAAASRDSRFPPVGDAELPAITIEISVLGDRRRVQGPQEIEIGKHGLCIEYHGHRGVLLPQVATEHGWDAPTFLERLCGKAGLPPGSWREPDALVEVFSAQVFDEKSHPPPVFPPMPPMRN